MTTTNAVSEAQNTTNVAPLTATQEFENNLFEIATILMNNGIIKNPAEVEDFRDRMLELIEETRAELVTIAYGDSVCVNLKVYNLITSRGADKAYTAFAIRKVFVTPEVKENPEIQYYKINQELAKFK